MRILVVEASKKLARFLVRALAEEGYVVDHEADGSQALRRILTSPYDLVILEWMIPEVDGINVCREVRASGNLVPILMLTARAEVAERIVGLDAGADDFVTKPFDLGELLARARALVRRGIGEAVLRIGPLLIDRIERRALVDGKRVDLTQREFTLLAHLTKEAGRDVPRSEILSTLQASLDLGSNMVDVYVKNLRSKLGLHGRMIETVRGVGYRLVMPM